jgi:tetratricopeptide (TPR) repeat protein
MNSNDNQLPRQMPLPLAARSLLVCAQILASLTGLSRPVQGQVGPASTSGWVGQHVMMRTPGVKLRYLQDGKRREAGVVTDAVVRVEQAAGDWLWVRSGPTKGWLLQREVVPVDEALREFDPTAATGPQAAHVRHLRGVALTRAGRHDQALDELEAALRLEPGSVLILVSRGNAWFAKGDHDRAIADFSNAIERDGRFATAWMYRGIVRSAKGDHDAALRDLDEALRLEPRYALAFNSRGTVWQAKGDSVRALADFDEAIRLDVHHPWAFNNRGNLWFAKPDFEKAAADYTSAIAADPREVLPYLNRGTVWQARGKFDQAVADYEAAIRIDPNHALAHNSLAWLLATCPEEKFRDGRRAVEEAKKSYELSEGKRVDFLDTLAAAHAEAGEFDQARSWQAKAVELAPESKKPGYVVRLKLYESRQPFRDIPAR